MSITKNILVPLDGSELAEAALPLASAIASRGGASVTLVRAVHYNSRFGDVAVEQRRVIQEAEAYLTPIAEGLSARGVTVETAVPFGASPADWIIEEAQLRHVDLIVMATHDRHGSDRLVHGSVAETVVHRSSVPVMLVRTPHAAQPAQRFEAKEPVLIVPLDGSSLAESALPVARDLARASGGRVVLLGVVVKPGQLIAGQRGGIITYTEAELARMDTEATAYLQGIMGRVGASAQSIEVVVRRGDPATEISAAAEGYPAAAVVMATRGRTGLVRAVFGSVAGQVLHNSSCPVVLVHPSQLRPAEQPAIQQPQACPVG